MCAKKRTLKPEKYGQKPRAQKELVFRERNKNKMLGKVSGGDDPGGRLGRTINLCSENVQRRKSLSPLLPSKIITTIILIPYSSLLYNSRFLMLILFQLQFYQKPYKIMGRGIQ